MSLTNPSPERLRLEQRALDLEDELRQRIQPRLFPRYSLRKTEKLLQEYEAINLQLSQYPIKP